MKYHILFYKAIKQSNVVVDRFLSATFDVENTLELIFDRKSLLKNNVLQEY